jgi:hypothetical protein
MAKKKIIKASELSNPNMNPMDMVQNPNFNSLMQNQNYFNTLSQLLAERQARGPESGIMPIGGTGISAEQMQNLTPERRQALEEAIAMQKNIPQPNPNFYQIQDVPPIPTSGSAMPPANQNFYQAPNPPIPTTGSAMPPVGQMNPMANYNQMLQQGMQRNTEMNQAGQNLAAPAGPAKSFSQMAGGPRRTNRAPRQPRNNSLAPSNQRLI